MDIGVECMKGLKWRKCSGYIPVGMECKKWICMSNKWPEYPRLFDCFFKLQTSNIKYQTSNIKYLKASVLQQITLNIFLNAVFQ